MIECFADGRVQVPHYQVAKARGITVIVDGSQVPVVYAADSIDITRAFIADFNSKNPATASVTQP